MAQIPCLMSLQSELLSYIYFIGLVYVFLFYKIVDTQISHHLKQMEKHWVF